MSNAIVDGLQRGIRSRSPWFWPFIVAVVLQVAAYLLSYSARIEAMQSLLPETATAHDRLAAAQMIWNWAPTRCLFLPLRLLFAWSVFAFTLFYLIRLFNPPNPVRFRQFLSLEIFAEWLPALGGGDCRSPSRFLRPRDFTACPRAVELVDGCRSTKLDHGHDPWMGECFSGCLPDYSFRRPFMDYGIWEIQIVSPCAFRVVSRIIHGNFAPPNQLTAGVFEVVNSNTADYLKEADGKWLFLSLRIVPTRQIF